MNIILTDKCSNNCPYCFAKEKLEADTKLNQMPLENYSKILAFLKKSRCRMVKLLGGEPMLHSQIGEIIKMAVEDDAFDNVVLFTGGIFDRSLVPLLLHEKINVVLNTNAPSDYKDGKWEIFMKNLDYMVSSGVEIALGYNIYKKDFDYDFILELLDYFKIDHLRWTVAVPMFSYDNSHISLDDYSNMGRRITEFLLKFGERRVHSNLDCFVPLCTFSDSDYGKLIKRFPGMAKGGICKPAIDVGPDLSVWRCFAISRYENVRLEDYPDLNSLVNFFISSFDHYKWHIWPKKCENCEYRKSRICQSSCLSFKADEIEKFLKKERSAEPIAEEAKKLFSLNKYSEASSEYSKALSIAPYSIKLKADASLCFIKDGKFSPAEELLSDIEKEYPNYPPVHIYRGFMCEQMKDYDKSLRFYRKALRLCPGEDNLRDMIKSVKTAMVLDKMKFF